MPTFVGMTNQEMAYRDASFRRKPESSAGEWQSTVCTEQLQLIKDFFRVEQCWVPTAVYQELAQTDLMRQLLAVRWFQMHPSEPQPNEVLLHNSNFQNLGAGERACISLAYRQSQTVLLMNDNNARAFAQSLQIITINIPAFLMACKKSKFIKIQTIRKIVEDLKEKDFYKFSKDVRHELLREY
jgi:predicted nucleic acid-binding protein